MKSVTAVTVAVSVLAAGSWLWPGAAEAARPWVCRKPESDPRPAHQLRSCSTWPAEPAPPQVIEDAPFRRAFAHLCVVDEDGAVAALSHDILRASQEQQVDPFTLAALAYYGSNCRPRPKGVGGIGFLAINPDLHRGGEGAPAPPVDRADLTAKRLIDPVVSIDVGAKLLKFWGEKHVEIDEAFGSVPHRSEVSHFVWGDDVRSSGHEDLILTARRRMLASYVAAPESPRETPLKIGIMSPLEAPPRVATSGPGEDRDGGARQHRGLDIVAALGEPVRSVADGVVIFAGANLPGRPRKGDIPPDKIGRYARRRLGVGGIYVCIEHAPDKHIVSCYMHLASYLIREQEHVSAGQTIGFVGRTGVKVSPPHLHFELRVDERFTNPARTLGDLVIPPKATQTYRYVMKARRAKRLRS